MTLTSCALNWTSGQYNWCSKAAGSVGLRIDEAFTAFAAAVNPNNPSHPLSVLKNHNSATGTTSFGYVWQLGHPTVPIVLGFWNTTLAQGNSSSSSSATLRLALQSAYTADSANAGYGTFASTILAGSRGLTHYTPAAGATPVISTLAGWLGIAFDDTPGAEWFLWAHGPNYTDLYTANFVGVLVRTENGWAPCIYRGSAYLGQAQTWDRYMVLNGTLTLMGFPSTPTGLIQQVRNGLPGPHQRLSDHRHLPGERHLAATALPRLPLRRQQSDFDPGAPWPRRTCRPAVAAPASTSWADRAVRPSISGTARRGRRSC